MFGLVKRFLKKLEVLIALYLDLPNMTLPVFKVQLPEKITGYHWDWGSNPIRAGPW